MMWIEMSRDKAHGGTGWGFTECLWSPTHKNPSGKWAFWELLPRVQKNDIVIHLQGKTHNAFFVGYSTADANGYKTKERPPEPKEWKYASSYYRVPLKDFVPFADPISLDDVFRRSNIEMRKYFQENKKQGSPEHIFYVVQSGRLQCLNGAYLSELSGNLGKIIFGENITEQKSKKISPAFSARTGEQTSQIMARFGQDSFSENVRENYGYRCCFPDCPIVENNLLVGAHIARWADAPELRGQTSNGLCLCLFHDKAFEVGFFTLTREFKVAINKSKTIKSNWANLNILPHNGQQIRLGEIVPAGKALEKHWIRINFAPQQE